MGHAAYMRGSKVIAEQIARDYESSPTARKHFRERLVRAELRIDELEQFCRDAQDALVRIRYEEDAKGFALSNARYFWLKKKDTKAFKKLEDECVEAHCAWVASDRMNTFLHLSVCVRKAAALLAVLNTLNRAYVWSFEMVRA